MDPRSGPNQWEEKWKEYESLRWDLSVPTALCWRTHFACLWWTIDILAEERTAKFEAKKRAISYRLILRIKLEDGVLCLQVKNESEWTSALIRYHEQMDEPRPCRMNFHLTRLMSGHGCYNTWRLGKLSSGCVPIAIRNGMMDHN